MQMKTIIMAGLLVSMSSHATIDSGPSLLGQKKTNIIKANVSAVVASYACRTTLDGGNGLYHQTLKTAEEAFIRATDNKEKSKEMIPVLEKNIENTDPGAQLLRQFDEVNVPPEMRKRSCEQMVEGSAQRAKQAEQ
ncbi:hypothetical protein [Morganella morganii]|uniref:hypothetical protein n=1 Tax=Morganella morganii TaxID=582 RepID=UPI002FD974E7